MKRWHPIALWVTFGASGYAPVAPGTMGTLAAMPAAYLLIALGGMTALLAASVIAFLSGWWASAVYMRRTGRSEDPKEIVIDEVAGVWACLCGMPLLYQSPDVTTQFLLFLAAFVAFRAFDIAKPWPVSVIDRRMKSPLGVMLDDLAAAVLALLLLEVTGHLLVRFEVIAPAIQ